MHAHTHTHMRILNDFQSTEATVVTVLLKNCKSHWDGRSMSLEHLEASKAHSGTILEYEDLWR